jgi:glycosyltransferase involved in cell wall biosynthesis
MNMLHKNDTLPTISVIIPNYNNSETLENCIASCINQNGDFTVEIIVVDDYSTDNSWNILGKLKEQYPENIKIFKNRKKGGNYARIYGFQQSSGNYIQWLDSDDILLEGKFQKQVEVLKNNFADVAYSDSFLYYFDNEKNHISTTERKGTVTHDFLSSILQNKWNPIHSYLFTREIVQKTIAINGWNPKTVVGQDREFVTKSALLGAKFIYVKGFYSVYNIWQKPSVSKVSHKQNIRQSTLLNQEFYNLINQHITDNIKKKKYIKILNTQIVKSTYYYPTLRFPRKIPLNQVNWKIIDKRIIPIVGFLAILKNFNISFSENPQTQ